MSKFLGTYNFNEVICTIAGERIVGFVDGDAITIEHDESVYAKTDGTDGTSVRSRMNYFGGTVTINIHPQSPSYPHIMDVFGEDAETGDNPQDITIEDIGDSGEKTVCRDCYLQEWPDRTYGREVGERSIVLTASEIVHKD